jgi:hypothetical protein
MSCLHPAQRPIHVITAATNNYTAKTQSVNPALCTLTQLRDKTRSLLNIQNKPRRELFDLRLDGWDGVGGEDYKYIHICLQGVVIMRSYV